MPDVFEVLKSALAKVDALRVELDSANKIKEEASVKFDGAVEAAKKAHAEFHEHVSASVPGLATAKPRVI